MKNAKFQDKYKDTRFNIERSSTRLSDFQEYGPTTSCAKKSIQIP